MTTTAALYLIPVGISDAPAADVIPQGTLDIMGGIQHFIVENVRTARRWLRLCMPHCDIDSMTFRELNRHTDISEVASWLDPLRQGLPMGVMSEAGCPGVADPGALPASIAQREGLRVMLVDPLLERVDAFVVTVLAVKSIVGGAIAVLPSLAFALP